MTSLAARLSTGTYRGFRWGLAGLAVLAAGVAASGLALIFTREPNDQWTTLARRGSNARPSPGLAEPLQDVHITLTILFALSTFLFITWLVGVVIAEWSWPLVLVVGALGFAVISGLQAGFLAVQTNGMWRDDLRGYGFLLDPGFDSVLSRGGATGATVFRVWTALHLLALPAMVALLVRGVRRWRRT